ncbi:MAG: hypothetical protein M9945_18835 [Aquamicrobium sp.]|uniref:hypothetical protein n=1 Tax=Aquamicrobium sp. TaxID=1872579 RepID=UPI00349EDC12|nr:hypothetical protein [Aquamicrobium sp.]
MTCSAGAFPVPDFCLIFAPLKGYDEPEILRSQLSRFGPISADAGQTPDEIINIKLKPTLTALGKLVESHTQRLEGSDQERTRQTEIITGTQNTIAQLIGAVEKSVAAMETAVAASTASQRTSEELVRVLQQQHDDLRKHIERTSVDQTQSMVRRIVDDLSSRVPAFTTSLTSPETAASPLSGENTPQIVNIDGRSDEQRTDKRWWGLR